MRTTTIALMETTTSTAPGGGYRPGACNIGPAEIERRRRSAIVATALTLGIAVVLVVTGAPALLRLVIAPFAAGTAISWLQVVRRFCVAFGSIGVQNFGPLGRRVTVADDEARRRDRRVALEMIAEGIAIGLGAALVLALLPF